MKIERKKFPVQAASVAGNRVAKRKRFYAAAPPPTPASCFYKDLRYTQVLQSLTRGTINAPGSRGCISAETGNRQKLVSSHLMNLINERGEKLKFSEISQNFQESFSSGGHGGTV